MSQLTMDEQLRSEFNDWARAGRGESMEQGHRPVGEQAIALMNIPANARVLDVGCGSGWASRLMAAKATAGTVIGVDISDEMVRLAENSSRHLPNVEFRVASAERLPFPDGLFTHAFSMESLYYYENMLAALTEIRRVLTSGGLFVNVVDLYRENRPSLQWVEQLKVPVQVLSTQEYHSLLEQAGFRNIRDQRLLDPAPLPQTYTGSSFKSLEDLIEYKQAGSLMITGEVGP
jgi:ubiquinone/menaquinone biosynthesis C-methylase UbiE